jgi:hypothetical protein
LLIRKKLQTIIPTLQMSQATSSTKSKIEILFDVSHLNLAPCIAIMFPFYSLHLPRVTIETNKGWGGGGVKTKHPQ